MRWLPIGLVLLLALALDARSILVHAPQGDLGIDFRVFARASADVAEMVYQPHRAPFAYPPPALLLMKPLTAFGYWPWALISAIAFAMAVAAVAGKRIAALSFLSQAAVKGLIQGQSAMLLGAMAFAGLKSPPIVGGMLWGIAAAVKPQLMLFAPLALLVRRDWSMLAGMAIGGMAMLLASVLLLDVALWRYWIEALPQFNRLVENGAMLRAVTPGAIAALSGLPTLPFILAGLALGTAAVIVGARRLENELLIGLIVAASLVASPYAHHYDLIALIPACAALMLRGQWWAAIPAAMIFIGTPILTMTGLMVGLMMVAAWPLNTHPLTRKFALSPLHGRRSVQPDRT